MTTTMRSLDSTAQNSCLMNEKKIKHILPRINLGTETHWNTSSYQEDTGRSSWLKK